MIRKAFLTDGKESATLAVLRSLGKEGVNVIAGDDHRLAPSRFSKYCGRFFLYPAVETDTPGYLEKMMSELKKEAPDLFFLTSDSQMLPVMKHWDEISRHTRIAAPPPDTLIQTLNKTKTLELAKSLSVKTPKTIVLKSPADLEAAAGKLSFPLVVKYDQTCYWKGNQVIPAPRVGYAYSLSELRSKLQSANFEFQAVLLQEFISGPGIGIFGLFNQGNPLVLFSHQRLRETNPTGSAACEAMSIPLDPAGKEMALAFMRALRWNGVAMLEFKKDSNTGELKLLEVNGRFWGSLPLALHCGVNFPVYLAKMWNNEACAYPESYPERVRCRHTNRYLTHLLHVMKGPPSEWQGQFPGRIETLKDFLKIRGKGLFYYSFEPGDPMPEAADILLWFQMNAEKVAQKIWTDGR